MIIADAMIIDHQRSMIMTWGYEHWSLWSLIMLIHTWMCCSYYDRLLIMGDDMLIIAMNRLWSSMINDIFMSSWTLSWTLIVEHFSKWWQPLGDYLRLYLVFQRLLSHFWCLRFNHHLVSTRQNWKLKHMLPRHCRAFVKAVTLIGL